MIRPTAGMSFANGARAFRHRNYRLYFGGQLVSLVGTWMQAVAQGWLILQLTGDPFLLGRRRRHAVDPGHGPRPVRRDHHGRPAQAADADRDPGDQDGPVVRDVRAGVHRPRRGVAGHGPRLPGRPHQRRRHAHPPGVLGRDGRPRGRGHRRRPQLRDVQRGARARPRRRRPDHRRVRHLHRLPHRRRQLPRGADRAARDARQRAPQGRPDRAPHHGQRGLRGAARRPAATSGARRWCCSGSRSSGWSPRSA